MTLRIWHLFIFYIPILHISSIIKSAQYPPTMIKQPPFQLLYKGSEDKSELNFPVNFSLDCEAEGNPEPVYQWKRNGIKFDYKQYGKRISQQPGNGTLVFAKAEDTDEGFYQCFAENIYGTSVSNLVFLRKSTLSRFPNTSYIEMIAEDRKPLTLKCDPPTGYPSILSDIIWFNAGPAGDLRNITNSRITTDPEGNLHFSNLIEEDFRLYVCAIPSNSYRGYIIGNRVDLILQRSYGYDEVIPEDLIKFEPVRQYVSPSEITVLKNDSVSLSCIFGGEPLPSIEWKKIDGHLDSIRYQFEGYGKILKISQVEFEDEATYECTASNGIGKPQNHAMNVKVEAAPYWIETTENTNCSKGESVKFRCEANGVPEPKIQWYINGVSIQKAQPNPRRTVKGNILIIENIVKFDTAVYKCNASNIHGYAFHNFYLNVFDTPCISRFEILSEKINSLEKKIDYVIEKLTKE